MTEARLLYSQSLLLCDQSHPRPARAAIAAAKSIYRREGRPKELACALIHDAMLFTEGHHDYGAGKVRNSQALMLLDPGDSPLITGSALCGVCYSDLRNGNWQEALTMLRRYRRSMILHDHGRNRARIARMEGEILGHAGDLAGGTAAIAFSRRELTAIGQPYEAGVAALSWAKVLRSRGEVEAAQAQVQEATAAMLRLNPHHEVYVALMLLRTANRFSQTREEIPLDAMVNFLSNAEFNPSIRFQSYLA